MQPINKNEGKHMSNYTLSIIIPAYNAAIYIEETLTSILKQKTQYTYEIIIINDGSTDNTAEVMDKFAQNFPNINLINIENSGPAIARNIGISCATGDFISFIDSDDRLFPDAIENLISLALSNNSDLVICGFEINNIQIQERFTYHDDSCILNSKEELGYQFTSLYEKNLLNQIWNKVYRRTLLTDNQITFPNYKYGEDRLFVFQVLETVNRVTVTSDCYYEYYMRDNDSLVSKYCEDKFEICCEINRKLVDLATSFSCLSTENTAVYDYMFTKSVISCITVLHSNTCLLTKTEKKAEIAKIFHTPSFLLALKQPSNMGFYFKVLKIILKTKNVSLAYITTYWITNISKIAPKLFIRAKHFHNKK